MEDNLMNDDNVRLESLQSYLINPGEIREPKCNLKPFRYYEIIIAVVVILAPYVVLTVLPKIYCYLSIFQRIFTFNFLSFLGIYQGILYIILVHFIYKKIFCQKFQIQPTVFLQLL